MLKQEAARIEYTLKKLRNPLKLKLPPKPVTQTMVTDIAGMSSATPVTVTLVDNPQIPPKIIVDPAVTSVKTKVESAPVESKPVESKEIKSTETKEEAKKAEPKK